MSLSIWTELSKRHGVGSFNYHVNISLVHRYVYVEIPKCASSTLKANLGRYELRGSGAQEVDIQAFFDEPHVQIWESPFCKPFQLGMSRFDTLLTSDETVCFTFVRNPFARAASAYLNKIRGGKKELDSLRPQLALIKSQPPDAVAGQEVSFVEFLRALSSMPASHMNAHFRPQTEHICMDVVPYQVVGRLETFDDDFASLMHRLNLRGVEYLRHPFRTEARDQFMGLYDDEAQQLVRWIYGQDFSRLGYSEQVNDWLSSIM